MILNTWGTRTALTLAATGNAVATVLGNRTNAIISNTAGAGTLLVGLGEMPSATAFEYAIAAGASLNLTIGAKITVYLFSSTANLTASVKDLDYHTTSSY